MRKEQKFFLCKHCGNLVGLVNNAGVPMICCGEEMLQLQPNGTDGAQEKHVPVVESKGDTVTVTVGQAGHPMTKEHSIQWIYLETRCGGQRKNLAVGEEPQAEFALVNDEPLAAFAYCNLHGLWKTEL